MLRIALGFCLLGIGLACACSVPVFRYALERWPAADYYLLVFHDQPLSEAQEASLAQLAKGRNLVVRKSHKDSLSPEHEVILGDNPLPWAALRYPESESTAASAWAGPLDQLPPQLSDSPARRELVKHLANGVSVVWLVVDGDEATDQLLRTELERLSKTIKLPDVEPADLRTGLPLAVRFEVIALQREGPEADLARELLQADPELSKAKGPVIFPVVGRGRMLWGLHGEGLSANEIAQSATYACGACSCQVKEANPGMDLLLPADWPTLLDVEDLPEPPNTLAKPMIPPGSPELEADSQHTPSAPVPNWLWQLMAALAVLLFIIGIVWSRKTA
jgi:hypothetical protein